MLMVLPPEAGPSRVPPQKPKHTAEGADLPPGVIIPEKNCMRCIVWESLCLWDPDGHVWSC